MDSNRPMESKVASLVPQLPIIEAKDRRRAFGNIHNNIGLSSSDENNQQKDVTMPIAAAYKDVKPREDTRRKEAEVSAPMAAPRISKPSASTSSNVVPKPAPLLKQVSKGKLSTVSDIPAYKRIVKPSRTIELKREPSKEPPPNPKTHRMPRLAREIAADMSAELQEAALSSHSSRPLTNTDIDGDDKEDPQLLSVYVNDIYKYLFKLEKLFPIRAEFLANQTEVTSKMRSVLLDWINEVHFQFFLEIETYYMAVSMIDRYLQSTNSTPRNQFQLVGVTVLFIASKYEELMPPPIEDFVYVTKDTYSNQEILQMEKKVVQALGFNLSKPLPIHFLRRFTKAAGPLDDCYFTAAKYFMELATIDYEMTKYNPSMVAAASLYLSLYIFNAIKSKDDLWTNTLEHHSTYLVSDMMPAVSRLATLAFTAKDVELKSVFNKYSQPIYKSTSRLPEMTGAKIQELIEP